MIKKGNLIQYIIIIAIVVIAPLFALSANQNNNSKSFLKVFYCNTLGKWFNDSYCIKVDVIEDSTNPSITLGVNNQTSITNDQLPITNNPSSAKASNSAKATSDKSNDKQTPNTNSTLTTQTNPATSFEVNNQTPNTADQTQANTNYQTITQLNNNSAFSSSDFVTRDFLSRQVGAIGDSFGRSLSNLSTQLTALIPSTASISNWDTFFATPSTRITAGAGLSWSGNTLSATGVSGSNFGESMTLSNNVFSVLALSPTTTVPISISSTATSTFAGGLEAWRQVSSPYFQATSTTATSTFAGGILGPNYFTVQQSSGNVGIGTTSPIAKLNVVGSTILKGNTYLNTGGGRQYLRDFDAALNTTNGSSTIVFIGDSWTHGQGYTVPIKSYLQKQYGDAGPGYVSANTAMPTIAGITRSKQGTWSTASYTYGPSLSYAVSTGVATTTFSGDATNIVFQYMNVPNGDDLTYSIDGVGTTTISTANAVTSTQFVNISGLTAGVVHRLDIVSSGTGSSGVTLIGADFQINSRSGVNVKNIAYTGSSVSTWLNIDATYWQDSLAILRPNLVVIMLGVNDAFSATPSTYKANLRALIARIETSVPRSSIMILSPSDISGATLAPMEDYVDAMSEVAASEQIAFVNNYSLIGDYATANARGIYANTTHLNATGYGLIAKNFITFIQQAFPVDINSVAGQSGSVSLSLGINSLLNNTGTGNTAYGNYTLQNNTTGSYNSVQGAYTLYYNTTGSYNTAQGQSVLFTNTTGSSNSAQGFEALRYNTSATNTTAVGANAGRGTANYYAQGGTYLGYNAGYSAGSGGDYNTMLGYEAGYATTVGDNALYAGYRAGYYATSSLYSTYLGYEAGRGQSGTHQMGDYNTAIGYKALNVNTTGAYNLAIGTNALASNTTGSYNTAQGINTLTSNTTGNSNTSQGFYSLRFNTTGSNNSTFGAYALHSNTTGSNNSAQGYSSLYYNVSATNTTAVGYQAGAGTANYYSQGGTYLGYQAGYSAGSRGDYNTLLGYQAGYNVSTGKYNIILGQNVNATSSDSVGGLNIGNVLFGTGMYTGGTVSATALTTGTIGIATSSPWRTLSVTGTVGFDGLTGSTGAGSICLSANKELVYNASSDACLPSLRSTKHDISNLSTSSLSTLNLLTPVSFIYNQGDDRTRYGFIAEDVSQIDTHLATYNERGEISGIDDRALIALAIGSIKELDIKIRNILTSVGEWVFSKITATLGVFDRIETKTASISDGIQMVDKTTGQIYCLNINNGNLDKSAGPCSTATTTVIISPTPTPEPSPTVILDSTPTPSTTPLSDLPTPTPSPSPDPTITPIPEPSPTLEPTPTPSITPMSDLPTPTPDVTPFPEPTPTAEPAEPVETVSIEPVNSPVIEPSSQPVSEPTSSETTE